jgi:hypothetical protein
VCVFLIIIISQVDQGDFSLHIHLDRLLARPDTSSFDLQPLSKEVLCCVVLFGLVCS